MFDFVRLNFRLKINGQEIIFNDKMHAQALVGIDSIELNFNSCAKVENLKIFGISPQKNPNHPIYDELITFEQVNLTQGENAIVLKPNGAVFEADVDDLTGIRIGLMIAVVVY